MAPSNIFRLCNFRRTSLTALKVAATASSTIGAACLTALGLATSLAHAQDTPKLPLWEVGAFATGLSQQAYPGASQQIDRALVLPFFIYRGKYFRADRDNVGLRAVKTDTLEVDIGFGGAFGANSNDIDARKGMPDLGTLVEFGPRIKWNLGTAPGNGRLRAEVALRGVFDVTDSFRDKGLILEPEITYERRAAQGWSYSTTVGLVFGDQRLADTFYGVASMDATASRTAYTARGGLIASRLTATVAHTLSPDLRVFGFARLASVEGGANVASPLVRQNTGATIGVGLTYILARSRTSSGD